MVETLQNDLGYNRAYVCSCVSYQLVHLEVGYVKLNLATFHQHVILQSLKLFTPRE